MQEIAIIKEEDIKDKIYVIRGLKVMIDSDLAEIYGYTTGDFNKQVKNNIERFEEDFMFQLTHQEYNNLIWKNSISKNTRGHGGRRKLPYAFTEQGIYMLMTVLKGEKAVEQSKAFGLIPGLNLKSSTKDNGIVFSVSGKVKMLKTLMKQLNKDYDESKVTGDTKQEAIEEFTGEGYTCETFE